MSLLSALRLRQSRWPLLVLLISIGLTAIAAIDAQRAVKSQQALAERALKEYASFAAWSYAQHLAMRLYNVQREAIGAVNHGENMHTNPRVPPAIELSHYLPWDEGCNCRSARNGPNPDAFFAIKLGQRRLDVAVNQHANVDGWSDHGMQMPMRMSMPLSMSQHMLELDRVTNDEREYPAGERTWLLDTLTRRVRNLGETDRGFTVVIGNAEKTPHAFIYTLMPTSWGDTMVYGARYSNADFVGLLEGTLDSPGLLPETFTAGRRNRDVVTLRVRDHAGHTIFASPAEGMPAPVAHVDLPARFGMMSVDASIRPELAGVLLVGGLPRSHLPFLLGLLALAAALSIVAVMQLRREGELARLRGDFVSSVSHELRTPLAQIRLYIETLQLGRATTEEQRRWSLSHIERETTRLSHLVENVLRFSTLGRDDPTTRAPMNVSGEVERMVDEFQPLALSRRATIRVETDESPATVLVRPDALRHIVLNLLDNAVKYGPVGGEVVVRVSSSPAIVTITVDDEGPGIAVNERESVWRPFARGQTAATNGGSGIGLTIVREVAEAHGGTARVESSPSGGARFVVTLPASTSTADVSASPVA